LKIPIELNPFPNEILSSWLIRNSIANGSDPSSWVSGVWFNFRAWTRDIDRHLPPDKINKLSKITSLTPEQIRNITLEPTIEKISSNYSLNPKKSWLFIIPTGHRGGKRINGTYFCQDCLKERHFYLKKQWRFAWNVACPIHKQLLLYKCPKCNEAFAPHLINYQNTQIHKCAYCGYDLRLCTSTLANSEVLDFQEKLNEVVFSQKKILDFPLVETNAKELFYTIRILLSFFRYAAYSIKHKNIFKKFGINRKIDISNYSKGVSFESMSIQDRQQLLFITSRLSGFNLEEIENVFLDNNVHQKTLLNQIALNSKTINGLASKLPLTNSKIILQSRNKPIFPNSKEEVERLMNNIRKFI